MFIRIREETFGYVFFDSETRDHHFVETSLKLSMSSEEIIRDYLVQYFGFEAKSTKFELISPNADPTLPLSAPIGMYLEISPTCNLSCQHCYKPKPIPGAAMTTDKIIRLIDELSSIGIFEIRLCGNEPTIHPDFERISRHIMSHHLFLGVNTNAYFDDDPIKQDEMANRLIKLRPNFVVVSLDGSQQTHNAIRKRGSYERVIFFLKKLAEAKIPHRINTVLSGATLPDIRHIVDVANATLSSVSFLPLRPVGRKTKFKVQQPLTKETMFSAVQDITNIRKQYPKLTLLTYFDILGEKSIYHHSMDFNKPCPARKNGFIDYSGDFYPCDFLRYTGDKFLCGNVTEKRFSDLWKNSSVLHGFQNMEHKKCKRCKFYMTRCYGGCICGSISSTGSPDDELCFVELI